MSEKVIEPDCPFVNLPEAKSGRWGAGLTAAKTKDCRWLKPVLVAQVEFLEWTGEITCVTPSSNAARKIGRLAANLYLRLCDKPHQGRRST